MLLYRVDDCVMHLCPICNRRTINVLDDDDDDDDDRQSIVSYSVTPKCMTLNDLEKA